VDRGRVISESTLSSKGQTTIAKEIRDGLAMKAGDRMALKSGLMGV
jgi:bifunctional DNA-binding transcriptional regulator/antitoxin component of YhaV-PrlF toxin-antitoxin module